MFVQNYRNREVSCNLTLYSTTERKKTLYFNVLIRYELKTSNLLAAEISVILLSVSQNKTLKDTFHYLLNLKDIKNIFFSYCCIPKLLYLSFYYFVFLQSLKMIDNYFFLFFFNFFFRSQIPSRRHRRRRPFF